MITNALEATIRRHLDKTGVSLNQLADDIGVSASNLSRWLNRKPPAAPSAATIDAVAAWAQLELRKVRKRG